MNKWIFLCLISVALMGCAKTNQVDYPKASPCRAIKEKLDAVYPSRLQTRQKPTERAVLIRDYEYYHCQN